MKHITCLLIGLLLIIGSLTPACTFDPPPALEYAEPDESVILYEENNATQDIVCVLDIPNGYVDACDGFDCVGSNFMYDFTSIMYCDNDEARSLVLKGVQSGLNIKVYDDSSCTRSGPTTKIVVKQDLQRKVINSFETAVSSPEVDVILLEGGGNLDGEVSCVEVGYSL